MYIGENCFWTFQPGEASLLIFYVFFLMSCTEYVNFNINNILGFIKRFIDRQRQGFRFLISHGGCHYSCFPINLAHNFELLLTFVCFSVLKKLIQVSWSEFFSGS